MISHHEDNDWSMSEFENACTGLSGRGFILAAPHSGSGKTTLTIGLLRALARQGHAIQPAKVGPDYIDPQFHQVASGMPSLNLDGWAMRGETLSAFCEAMAAQPGLTVIEGVMGLFDGAVKAGVLGHGATADLAKFLGLPVILVVDCAGMGQSVAALVKGFASFDPDVHVAGVILNKLGSLRHVDMMTEALMKLGMPVIGAVTRSDEMELPSRHLGLVQAGEMADIEARIELIADHVERSLDFDLLLCLAGQFSGAVGAGAELRAAPAGVGPAPIGQSIAVASDEAFRFFYPHLKKAWLEAQVSLSFFSPLADEAPAKGADAIFLPGGYPELYAGQLAGAGQFRTGMKAAAESGKVIYGECGGYMTLGDGLTDKNGQKHQMLGLLQLETSFETRKLHLGYRHVKAFDTGLTYRGHEFHYSTICHEQGSPLYKDMDSETVYGLRDGSVAGSFIHLIDQAA